MRLTLRELRYTIRRALNEKGTPPYINNVLSPESDDRPAIEKMTLKTLDGEEELAPHLIQDPVDQGDCQGPVGRRHARDDVEFAPQADPYTSDWSVIGNPRFKAAR